MDETAQNNQQPTTPQPMDGQQPATQSAPAEMPTVGATPPPTSPAPEMPEEKSEVGSELLEENTEKPKEPKNVVPILLTILLLIVLGALVFVFLTNRKTIASLREKNQQQSTEIARLQDENSATTSELAVIKDQMESTKVQPTAESTYPVQFVEGVSQKVGQTFQVATETTTGGMSIWASSGAGGQMLVSLYEVSDPATATLGSLVANGSFPAINATNNTQLDVLFGGNVTLSSEKYYMLIVEADAEGTQASVAFSATNVEPTGNMWIFTTNTWEAQSTQDLLFELL